MADTEKSEQPQTNGLENGLEDEDERTKLRPADIDADVKEMERRKRVEMIMSSKLFREELERIIELQMKDGNGPAGLLQQISDMMGIQSGKLHTTHMFRGSNCVTPINDIRGVESMGYEKGEKNLRCKLASVFRLMDLYGWSQGINNQITARLNQDQEHFLVNPHGMLFNEITASSLVKVDMQGNVVEPGTTNFNVHTQGFLLHSAIHASRPDVNCVIHIKTPSVLAVSSLKCGLLPLCQESLVIGEVSQHPFVCGIFEPEEREKIIRNLGPFNKVLLLYNHGAICCGATVEEAFYNVYNTVLACETQVKLMPIGVENLVLVNDETRKQVYDAAHKAPDVGATGDKKTKQFRVGELEFEALIRMLDNAGFRTGYIYRHPLVKGELPKPKNDVEVPPAVSSLGYLIEQEELYKQGNWKKYVDGRNRLDRTKWLNSPNVYQKVEILETGTSDPKKITKWVDQNSEEWVAESSPTHSSTPVKIESALQFVPKGTNPKEFKKLQQQIKENRRADKITSGPQSHILEGVSWEEAKKLQDANITQTGDQVILVGAASKGIIQRNYQHNALVYKTPYAKNPFDSMSDKEIEDYKQLVERKQRGDTDYEESQSESEAISSSRQDALRHLKSPLLSPQSATSETEEESRDEPRVLRIETKTAPRPIQAEVVLSDAESDSTDARVERSHSARYPKSEKPESVTLMNSFRKSWSLKREKDKSKDYENLDEFHTRNLHPSLILSDFERQRMESLHCCVARIKQLTHKPVIVDLDTKALRPLFKSASDPCNLSVLPDEEATEVDNKQSVVPKDQKISSFRDNRSDLKRILNVLKRSIYSAKMKFLGFQNGVGESKETQEKTSTSPMCALISEIRETINDIMSPERTKQYEESVNNFSSSRFFDKSKLDTRMSESEGNLNRNLDREELRSKVSLSRSFHSLTGNSFDSSKQNNTTQLESWSDFKKDFQMLPTEKSESGENESEALNCTCVVHGGLSPERAKKEVNFKPKVDENQNEENVLAKGVKMINVSDEEGTYSVTDDSLLQTYSFTETTETEWYYNKTIMKMENSQTVVEIKETENKDVNNLLIPARNADTGIDTDFTSEKENDEKIVETIPKKSESETTEDVDVDVPVYESSVLNKSSETDSSFLKSSSGQTSNDVDTSFAFKTETENSEKTHSPEKNSGLTRKVEDHKKFLEGMLGKSKEQVGESSDSGEANQNDLNASENSEAWKQKQIDHGHAKLPGIPESPEFTNIDTEDAPVTSSSKDTSPEIADNARAPTEEDPLEDMKEPKIEAEKEKEYKSEHKRKKNVKSSTKITVKKELKEKNSDEPLVSEIKLTIKNSNPCQMEKYEVKIQDVTNTSEELSRSVSSVGENMENYESFEVMDNNCGCEAQQNLEELQEEVSSTIEKLHTIEDYFEEEIKKHSNDSLTESERSKKESDEFTIEYNYREFEEILNESKGDVNVFRISELLQEEGSSVYVENGELNSFSEKIPEDTKADFSLPNENIEYFVSSIVDNICGEIEINSVIQDEIVCGNNEIEKPEFEFQLLEKFDEIISNHQDMEVFEKALEIRYESEADKPEVRSLKPREKLDSFNDDQGIEIPDEENQVLEKKPESEIQKLEICGLESKINNVEGGQEIKMDGKENQALQDEPYLVLEKPGVLELFENFDENGMPEKENQELHSELESEIENQHEPLEKSEDMENNNELQVVEIQGLQEECKSEIEKSGEGSLETFNEGMKNDTEIQEMEHQTQQKEPESDVEKSGEGSLEKFSEVNEDDQKAQKIEMIEENVLKYEYMLDETCDEHLCKTNFFVTDEKNCALEAENVPEVVEQIKQAVNSPSDFKLYEDLDNFLEEGYEPTLNEFSKLYITDIEPPYLLNNSEMIKSLIESAIDSLDGPKSCPAVECTSETKEILHLIWNNPEVDNEVKYKELEDGITQYYPVISENGQLNDDQYRFLQIFYPRLFTPLKAITWYDQKGTSNIPQTLRMEDLNNEPVDYILHCLLNAATQEDIEKLEPSISDVMNFILTNESPTDSLTEFEDMENLISASNSVVADLIDSVESQLEGELESLPDEDEMRDKDFCKVEPRKSKKPDSIFKVTVATPTKKEIFINYSVDSSSSFNISPDSDRYGDLCNSYIKTDDINDDFENLSSDNPEFFSLGTPGKNSLNSSFASASSGLDSGDHFCCVDCENNLVKSSPRSLGIIQEVDESDSSTSSEEVATSLPKK